MIVSKSPRARGRARRGAALVIALFVVLMVSVLSMSYLQMSLSKNREQQTAADAKRAFYIAEAGLAEAYAGILAGQSGNVGNDIVPARFGAGVFWVRAEDLGNANTCLTSTGLCGVGRACISVVVQNQTQTVASQGLFSDQSITIKAGSLVDSYDSRLGSYEAQANAVVGIVHGVTSGLLGGLSSSASSSALTTPAGTRVTSNGSIHLQGNTPRADGAKVVGTAQPGPQGIVDRGTGSTVTGATTPNDTVITLPEVPIPAVDLVEDIVWNRPGVQQVPTTALVGYQSLKISNGAEAVVRGPTTLVVDDLVLGAGTKLSIDTSRGPVKIFVRDWLNLAPGSQIVSVNPSPTKCTIMCAGTETVDRDGDGVDDPPVTLGSTTQFHGLLFAPGAAVTLPNTFHVYGALAAKALVVNGGGQVHFDRAFLDPNSDQLALPRELCWRLVQLPPSKIVEQRIDPLRYLAALGILPPAGKDAHYVKGAAVPTAITAIWNRVSLLP